MNAAELQRIYQYYCAYGKPGRPRWLSRSQLYKFARDTRIFENSFWLLELDSVVSQIVQLNGDEELQLSLDAFCETLLLIAERKYELTSAEALDRLLASHILPYATRAPADGDVDAFFEPSTVALVTSFLGPLRLVFMAICSGKFVTGRPQSWQEVCIENASVSTADMLRLWEVFDVVPKLVPKSTAMKLFRSSSMNGSDEVAGKRAPVISFPEFVECIVRCALTVCAHEPYSTIYVTTRQQVEALLVHMELGDTEACAQRLAFLSPGSKPTTTSGHTPATIREELTKAFTYYCNYQNQTNTPRTVCVLILPSTRNLFMGAKY